MDRLSKLLEWVMKISLSVFVIVTVTTIVGKNIDLAIITGISDAILSLSSANKLIILLLLIIISLSSMVVTLYMRLMPVALPQKPDINSSLGVNRLPQRWHYSEFDWRPAIFRREPDLQLSNLGAEHIITYLWLDGPNCPNCGSEIGQPTGIWHLNYKCPSCDFYVKDRRSVESLLGDAVRAYRGEVFRDIETGGEDSRKEWLERIIQ